MFAQKLVFDSYFFISCCCFILGPGKRTVLVLEAGSGEELQAAVFLPLGHPHGYGGPSHEAWKLDTPLILLKFKIFSN